MMMPANFSAVNAEVVYGGAVADYLPTLGLLLTSRPCPPTS